MNRQLTIQAKWNNIGNHHYIQYMVSIMEIQGIQSRDIMQQNTRRVDQHTQLIRTCGAEKSATVIWYFIGIISQYDPVSKRYRIINMMQNAHSKNVGVL